MRGKTYNNICAEMFSIENCLDVLKDELKTATATNKVNLKKEIRAQQKRYSELKSRLKSMENLEQK